MRRNFESNLIKISPRIKSTIFSKIFCIPNLDPKAVPKHPQSMFKPRAKLIAIAMMKTKSNPLRMAEFSFTDIPNTRSIPAQSSILSILERVQQDVEDLQHQSREFSD